jgi:hypothetical protein
MYYDVGDRIKIEFLAPRVVQAKFREIAKTITKPRFSVFLAISRTPKKMSEPGVINYFNQTMAKPFKWTYTGKVLAI